MNRLMQVGKSTWVDPEAIQAIEWSSFSHCPKILLENGLYILATNFKHRTDFTPDEEEYTNKLLELISKVMRKPTPPTFSGRSA